MSAEPPPQPSPPPQPPPPAAQPAPQKPPQGRLISVTPAAKPPAAKPAFEVHRSGRPGGGGPDVRQDPRLVRLLVAFVVFGGMGALGLWLSGGGQSGPRQLLPTIVDAPKLGMTVAELEALGARPYISREPDPEGPRQIELQDRIDRTKKGVQVVIGDPIVAETRFAAGKLVYFRVVASTNFSGTPIGPTDLLSLLPVLAEAKMLRRGYPQAELEAALGRGARCELTLDAALGATEVFRWDVVVDDREQSRFEAHVRDGVVVEHSMDQR